MSLFDRNEILPADPDLEVLHDREYRVRAFRKDPNLLIRGAVRDQKPPRLYIEQDDQPLTIHHMQVDLEIAFPSLEIVDAMVVFESHPHAMCTSIAPHYEKLIGLSIARGFTHRVRELFGGPRGCTHTTALLQAMAPVAVQCFWSMSASNAKRAATRGDAPGPMSRERAQGHWAMNVNTCHVWNEDGETVQGLRDGTALPEPPLFIRRRFAELGVDESEFYRQMGS